MRSLIAAAGYSAIARGVRVPNSQRVADYIQQSRLIDLLDRLDINLFLDVGANRGFFSKHLRQAGYKGVLCSFEPVPRDAEQIRGFAQGDDEWHVFECAAGAEEGSAAFSVYGSGDETVLSSFLELRDNDATRQTINVSVRRLDVLLQPLLATIPSPRIFLKCDTQGFDLQVVAGAEKMMPLVQGLQSEVSVQPLYAGMPHFTESLAHYETLGFGLMDLFVVHRLPDGRVLEYDCVMARPESLR